MRYLRNLILALRGRNPYQQELDGVREEYEHTVEDVRRLGEAHAELSRRYKETRRQVASCQVLIEHLRQRLGEKDELIVRMNEDYRRRADEFNRRVASYSEKIASLQDKLLVQKYLG